MANTDSRIISITSASGSVWTNPAAAPSSPSTPSVPSSNTYNVQDSAAVAEHNKQIEIQRAADKAATLEIAGAQIGRAGESLRAAGQPLGTLPASQERVKAESDYLYAATGTTPTYATLTLYNVRPRAELRDSGLPSAEEKYESYVNSYYGRDSLIVPNAEAKEYLINQLGGRSESVPRERKITVIPNTVFSGMPTIGITGRQREVKVIPTSIEVRGKPTEEVEYGADVIYVSPSLFQQQLRIDESKGVLDKDTGLPLSSRTYTERPLTGIDVPATLADLAGKGYTVKGSEKDALILERKLTTEKYNYEITTGSFIPSKTPPASTQEAYDRVLFAVGGATTIKPPPRVEFEKDGVAMVGWQVGSEYVGVNKATANLFDVRARTFGTYLGEIETARNFLFIPQVQRQTTANFDSLAKSAEARYGIIGQGAGATTRLVGEGLNFYYDVVAAPLTVGIPTARALTRASFNPPKRSEVGEYVATLPVAGGLLASYAWQEINTRPVETAISAGKFLVLTRAVGYPVAGTWGAIYSAPSVVKAYFDTPTKINYGDSGVSAFINEAKTGKSGDMLAVGELRVNTDYTIGGRTYRVSGLPDFTITYRQAGFNSPYSAAGGEPYSSVGRVGGTFTIVGGKSVSLQAQNIFLARGAEYEQVGSIFKDVYPSDTFLKGITLTGKDGMPTGTFVQRITDFPISPQAGRATTNLRYLDTSYNYLGDAETISATFAKGKITGLTRTEGIYFIDTGVKGGASMFKPSAAPPFKVNIYTEAPITAAKGSKGFDLLGSTDFTGKLPKLADISGSKGGGGTAAGGFNMVSSGGGLVSLQAVKQASGTSAVSASVLPTLQSVVKTAALSDTVALPAVPATLTTAILEGVQVRTYESGGGASMPARPVSLTVERTVSENAIFKPATTAPTRPTLAAIERVIGQSVYKPAGMEATTFRAATTPLERLITDTAQRTDTVQRAITGAAAPFAPVVPAIPNIPTIIIPPFLPSMGGGDYGRGVGGGRRGYAYAPSLRAVIEGITGKKPAIITGVGTRPITPKFNMNKLLGVPKRRKRRRG